MIETFDAVFGASGLACRPSFVWVAHAGGSIGFYTPGLIVLGAAEIQALASKIWTEYLERLTPENAHWRRLFGMPVWSTLSFVQVWWICVRVIMAHELGHARQAEAGDGRGGIFDEGDADEFAGRIAEVLGWDAELDKMVMHAIGCRHGAACDHPDPNGRVALYEGARIAEREMQSEETRRLYEYWR
jgi:hypothetical protein